MKIFGLEIKRQETEPLEGFVEQNDDDGVITIESGPSMGFFNSSFVDLDSRAKDEADLITRYRKLEQVPEVSRAIDDVINESIVISDRNSVVDINLDTADISDKIKKRILEEFETVLSLLDFSNEAYKIFGRWYVDGRIRFHLLYDNTKLSEGIKEVRYVDPRKLRKIRETEVKRDAESGIDLKTVKEEYWLYNDSGFGTENTSKINGHGSATLNTKIGVDSVVEVNSGLINEDNTLILSHIHKALKPATQLSTLEDAAVIYRLSRAPERRVFYIDVGNLPKAKAEQYMRDMMNNHKNQLVYNSVTGEVQNNRHHMSMMEDLWLPRREGGRGTEIDTLPSGGNLGEMDDILYFQKNLYKSLNIPISRLDSESTFNFGAGSEITRDEVKFARFVSRLRTRFSNLFDELLEKQLILKKVLTSEEWAEIKNNVHYDFKQDNYYSELKETEILRERMNMLGELEGYTGTYFSREYIRKNILRQNDAEIDEIADQIKKEKESGEIETEVETDDF